MTEAKGRPGSIAAGRGAARLAAVQALYQMDLAGTDMAAVIAEFLAFRFGGTGEGALPAEADAQHFDRLVRGVVGRQRDIDPPIDDQLAEGWRLYRIDTTVRAILRAGTFELLAMRDIPARVVISEYVEVAKSFFDAVEPKVVNGVLDKLARRFREGELD